MGSIALSLAVVVGFFGFFLLLWFRLDRIESHLGDMKRSLAAFPVRVEVPPQMNDDLLVSIRNLNQRIEGHLLGLLETRTRSRQMEAREMVERKLSAQGYDNVRLSTGEEGADDGDASKFHLEVTRRGVSYKGYALVRDGMIVDSKLVPTYEMFP